MGLLDKLFGKPKPTIYKYNVDELKPISEPMPEDKYWAIISTSVKLSNATDEQYQVLIESLKMLQPDEMIGFSLQTKLLLNKAYKSDVFCAAYIINGACSHEGFEYFRIWLISRGKDVFYQTLQNPDSLIEHLNEDSFDYDFEMFLYASNVAFEETTGKELYNYIGESENITIDTYDLDFNWEEDEPDSMKAICPKLFDKYWEE